MRDGEHRECPIVPSEVTRFNFPENGEYLLVAAHTDSIQMFPDPELTHLRYYDSTDGLIKAVWLPDHVLAELVDRGIPITTRDSITESEMEAFTHYMGNVAAAACVSVDPIEEEIAHLDQEIDYYLRHGGIEDL